MDIKRNHGAVDSNPFSIFNPFVTTICYQDAVDSFLCLRSYRLDIVAEGRLLESFISNTDTTETTITDRIKKMKSQIPINLAFHLFDNCSPHSFLCTHALGSDISMDYATDKILKNPFVDDMIGINNFFDAFPLLGVGMFYVGYGERDLFW